MSTSDAMTIKQIGDRLRAERERIGLSQESLAEVGGVSRRSQGAYELGKRPPDALYLSKIAKTGIDICFIVTNSRDQLAEVISKEVAAAVLDVLKERKRSSDH